jgi:hypothetical protein
MDLFPSSGEVGETLTKLDPLQRANLNHWIIHVIIVIIYIMSNCPTDLL